MKSICFALIGSTMVLAAAGAVTPQMTACRPGAVKPAGWLRDRALAARNGFTGHMDEISLHFRRAWAADWKPRGACLNWGVAGKSREECSWSSEGGAYWFDGLVHLAFQLDDPELRAMAKRRLDPLLDNMHPNSIGFVWWLDRRDPAQVEEAFGPGAWQYWVLGMSERVLSAWYAATGDERVKYALECAFDNETLAERMGAQPTFVSGLSDACRITGSLALKKCLDIACAKLAASEYANPVPPRTADTLGLRRIQMNRWKISTNERHGVICEESLLSVFRAWQRTGDAKLLAAVRGWYDFFARYCTQPYGYTMLDEEWGWAGAARGTETCDVAAELYTRVNLLAGLGEGAWGDQAERGFFNAGPACVARDFMRAVYFQLPNRIGAPGEGREFSSPDPAQTRYATVHWPLCCTAALNRVIPNYIRSMWMTTSDGGVAAALYGPSTFAADIPAGRVAFTESTSYPFDETIAIVCDAAPSSAFPLRMRIPGWCTAPEVRVNGESVAVAATSGFTTLKRAWKAGDRVELRFPMKTEATVMRDMNEGGRPRAFFSHGPLLFALGFAEKDENTPAGKTFEPVVDPATALEGAELTRSAVPSPWDWRLDAPLRLRIKAADGSPLELVPYGCTKLRISMFPVVGY